MEYSEFLELVNENKRILNELYNKDDSEILKRGCEICAFKNPSKAQKIAILRRVVDLKADPLLIELKKQFCIFAMRCLNLRVKFMKICIKN